VPYIHCPQCRLTIYGGIAYTQKECPRCKCGMSDRPRPLFRSLKLDGGLPRAGVPHPTPRPPASGGPRLSAAV